MRIFAFFVGLLCVTVFSVISSPSVHATSPKKQTVKSKHVEVQPGDSLTKIANKNQTTYPRIYNANKSIKDPDVIYPGDKLRIPHRGEKLSKRPLPGSAPPIAAPIAVTAKVVAAPSQQTPKQPSYAQAPTAPAHVSSSSVWDRLAGCESGGNWSVNTGNGFYGGLQFSLSSWRGVGGSGYPHQASRAEQIARAERLLASQGWGAWPACSVKLGLR